MANDLAYLMALLAQSPAWCSGSGVAAVAAGTSTCQNVHMSQCGHNFLKVDIIIYKSIYMNPTVAQIKNLQ